MIGGEAEQVEPLQVDGRRGQRHEIQLLAVEVPPDLMVGRLMVVLGRQYFLSVHLCSFRRGPLRTGPGISAQ